MKFGRTASFLLGLSLIALVTHDLFAQEPPAQKTGSLQDLLNQGDNGFGAFKNAGPKLSAQFQPAKAKPGDTVTLQVQLKLPDDHYTYPLKAESGSTTKISVTNTAGLIAVDKNFSPTKPPKKEFDPVLKETLYKHIGGATWTRKYRIPQAAKSGPLSVAGTIRYQVCTKEICKPPKTKNIVALVEIVSGNKSTVEPKASANLPQSLNKEQQPRLQPPKPLPSNGLSQAKTQPKTVATSAPENSTQKKTAPETNFILNIQPGKKGKPEPISLKFQLAPKDAKPGDEVTVSITANLDKGWHAYAITHDPEKGGSGLPVVITVQAVNGLEPVGKGWRPNKAPKLAHDAEGKQLLEHAGKVTWSRKFKVSDSAKAGAFGIRGRIKYQICNEGRCKPPKRIPFVLGDLSTETNAPAGSNDIDDTPFPGGANEAEEGSLAYFLLLAFLGGMILNVMPCVLPVIAIKVMSFVQQAGESRSRILALNISYSAGVIMVFLMLATLAVGLVTGGEKLGWGGLFQKDEFNVLMACVVFAMGLSLLGVFEIPIPGFVGSAAGGQHQEGLGGAFLTGIFATLLATPCTGPFLGTALAWSVKQPVLITYLMWGLMGLGMASPYLILGCFPTLIKFLPKPGNWMVRFKEIAGFILMGTVIFFISFMSPKFVVPLLIMLMGVAVGLWMIGNLYDVNSHIKHKTIVRVSAVVVMLVICGGGYSLTMESKHRLPWKEFNETNLQASLDNDKTVLVDFTADWCTNCKVNEKLALNRKETLEFVKKHNVVPLVADYTKESPEIKAWLDKFNTDGVPLTVIFPANRPDQPIVLDGVYSKGTLLEKLEEAVNIPKEKAKAKPAEEKQAALE
ncbi:MAG: hypothetical protein Tsb009_17990 [Planctomycetaceae bacterium]